MTTSKRSVFEEGLQTFPLRQSTASKLRKNFQGRKLSSSSFFDLRKLKKSHKLEFLTNLLKENFPKTRKNH